MKGKNGEGEEEERKVRKGSRKRGREREGSGDQNKTKHSSNTAGVSDSLGIYNYYFQRLRRRLSGFRVFLFTFMAQKPCQTYL